MYINVCFLIVYICINNEADEGALSSLRDGSDEDWLDELQLLGDEQLWRYGRGFSSYQAELYQELFLDVSSWHFGPPSAPLGDEDEDWDVCFEGFGEAMLMKRRSFVPSFVVIWVFLRRATCVEVPLVRLLL